MNKKFGNSRSNSNKGIFIQEWQWKRIATLRLLTLINAVDGTHGPLDFLQVDSVPSDLHLRVSSSCVKHHTLFEHSEIAGSVEAAIVCKNMDFVNCLGTRHLFAVAYSLLTFGVQRKLEPDEIQGKMETDVICKDKASTTM